MQSLGLDVRVLSADDREIEIHDTDEDITETAKELGIDLHEELPPPANRIASKDEEDLMTDEDDLMTDEEDPLDELNEEILEEEDIDLGDLK